MHCTLDTNTLHCWHSQSQTFLCTKDAWSPCCEEMSVVSLSGMFTEQWMSGTMTEVHPAASHSCQKDFSTRTLLLHAGWVFCRGAHWCAADYFNTVMLSLDMVMTVGTTVMRITNKSVNSATMYSNRTKKDDRNTLKPGPRVASLRLFQQKKKNHAQALMVLNVTGQLKAHTTFSRTDKEVPDPFFCKWNVGIGKIITVYSWIKLTKNLEEQRELTSRTAPWGTPNCYWAVNKI